MKISLRELMLFSIAILLPFIQPNIIKIHHTCTAGLRIIPVAKTKANRIDIDKVHAERLQVDSPLGPGSLPALHQDYRE